MRDGRTKGRTDITIASAKFRASLPGAAKTPTSAHAADVDMLTRRLSVLCTLRNNDCVRV